MLSTMSRTGRAAWGRLPATLQTLPIQSTQGRRRTAAVAVQVGALDGGGGTFPLPDGVGAVLFFSFGLK